MCGARLLCLVSNKAVEGFNGAGGVFHIIRCRVKPLIRICSVCISCRHSLSRGDCGRWLLQRLPPVV